MERTTALPGRLARRVLAREAWARERLASCAGRRFAIVVAPFTTVFEIGADGFLTSVPRADHAPDLTLSVFPLSLPVLLADPQRWPTLVTADGDPVLAALLQALAQTLPWFVERAFAAVFGPIVGPRVGTLGRGLIAWPGYASTRIVEAVAGHARDETRMLPGAAEFRSFANEAAQLAARTDALAERIAAVESQAAATMRR